MVKLTARVMDPTHLELSEPIGMSRGRTVLIVLAESAEQDVEREQWLAGSADSLRSAYSAVEPEYGPSMVKESNPDY